MKLVTIVGASAMAACAGGFAIAAHPPLDRPTPPPCCADGICYPNATEWGWYKTRWRRWPTEDLQPSPAAPTPMEKLGPDIPPFETPSVEHEDRRAPPPSKLPAEEPKLDQEAPATTPVGPPSGIGTEPGPTSAPATPSVRPLTSPLAPPTPPSGVPDGRMPWENDEEPTGDWDPPPSLPTATSMAVDNTSRRPSLRPAVRRDMPRPQPAPVQRPSAPASDPPPTLPVSLASVSY